MMINVQRKFVRVDKSAPRACNAMGIQALQDHGEVLEIPNLSVESMTGNKIHYLQYTYQGDIGW